MGMFQRDHQVFADAEPLDDSYEPEDIRERDEELDTLLCSVAEPSHGG